MEEIWKDLPKYEQYYMVSNLGRIKRKERVVNWKSCNINHSRLDKEKIIKQELLETGYLGFRVCINGKKKRIHTHRMVAIAFLKNNGNKQTVNHKDGDRANNDVSNLEWATYSENNLHSWRVLKRTAYNKRKVLCIETGTIFDSLKEAGDSISKGRNNIYTAIYRNCKAGGFSWKYV